VDVDDSRRSKESLGSLLGKGLGESVLSRRNRSGEGGMIFNQARAQHYHSCMGFLNRRLQTVTSDDRPARCRNHLNSMSEFK